MRGTDRNGAARREWGFAVLYKGNQAHMDAAQANVLKSEEL